MRIQPAIMSATAPSAARSGTRTSTSRMPPARPADCRKERRESFIGMLHDDRSPESAAKGPAPLSDAYDARLAATGSVAGDPRDELHFDDAAVPEQAGGADGRPCRIGRLQIVAGDLLEQVEMLSLRTFEVRPLPDVKAVDHHDIVERRARRLKQLLQALERAIHLQLERRRVASLILTPPDNDTGDVERVVDAANRGVAKLVVVLLRTLIGQDDAAMRRRDNHRPLLRLSCLRCARNHCDTGSDRSKHRRTSDIAHSWFPVFRGHEVYQAASTRILPVCCPVRRGLITISTSCPSAVRKFIRRSTENPSSLYRSRAET